MSETLLTCPVCKQAGFYLRGLKAHRCRQKPMVDGKRQGLTPEEIQQAQAATEVPPPEPEPAPKGINTERDNLIGEPRTDAEAVEYARRCVRALLASDYTADRADEEIMLGYGGPQAAGYQISRGKIKIPKPTMKREDRYLGGRGTEYWQYSFRKLADTADQLHQAELW